MSTPRRLRAPRRAELACACALSLVFSAACNAILGNELGYPADDVTTTTTTDANGDASTGGQPRDAASGGPAAHDATPDARAVVDAAPPRVDGGVDAAPPFACDGGLTLCNASCVDLASDDRNCGACGAKCKAKENCVNSACR